MKYVAALLGVCVLVSSASAQADVKEQLKAKAEELGKATIDGEYEKVVDATYAKVVEIGGGRAKVLELTRAAMSGLKAQGITITSYKASTPGAVVESGGKSYCIVPTVLTLAAPNAKITAKSYLLGVSTDKGKSWTFVDGAGLQNDGQVKQFLPDLPKTVVLPKPEQPKVEKQ